MRKLLGRIAMILALAGCVLLASCSDDEPDIQDEIASPVSVAEVKPDSIKQFVTSTGTVQAKKQIKLPALARGLYTLQTNPQTGKPYALGDWVNAGKPLITLVNPEESNALRLDSKILALRAAKLEFEKQQSLFKKGGVTQRELTDAERRYMDARYDHKSVLIKMAKMQVASTFDGYITALPYYTNNTPVDAGQPMAVVMDYGSMYLEVNLPGKDLGTINPGLSVNISNYALPDQMLAGNVMQVAPTLDPQSRSFKATITVQNDDWVLRPGMFVKADIVVAQNDSTIVIPKNVIIARDYGKIVYVVEKGAALERTIITGLENEGNIEVTSGLKKDERLVVKGFETLKNNSKVKIVR